MLKNLFIVLIISGIALISSHTTHAASNDQLAARQFVTDNANEILAILKQKDSKENKKERLTILFHKIVESDWMAKFVIAKNWRSMSADQQTQYIMAYKNYLSHSYVNKFAEFNGQNYNILESNDIGNGHFLVVTEIINTNPAKQNVSVSYRIKKDAAGNMRVIDIIGEGISLLATQRAEFSVIIEKQGINGLINSLLGKNTKNNGA